VDLSDAGIIGYLGDWRRFSLSPRERAGVRGNGSQLFIFNVPLPGPVAGLRVEI
jgi:hypothetical protein